MSNHIANWKLIKKIATEYTSEKSSKIISLQELERVFSEKYPNRNLVNVSLDTRMLTVNYQSRLSYLRIFGRPNIGKKLRHPHLYQSNQEYPRISSLGNDKDFFIGLGNSLFEIYAPHKHGTWIITLGKNDVNRIEKYTEGCTDTND